MMTNSDNMGMAGFLSIENINDLVETQLSIWDDAKARYLDLGKTKRRRLDMGDLPAALQLNPARIVSTAADTSSEGIAARKCFLCAENRPAQQICGEWMPGWDLCINPFPILPIHFTIISRSHEPQNKPPLEMAAMSEAAPDLAIFFNGARGGASAPDHLHLQGVLKSELPLLQLVERNHSGSKPGFMNSENFNLDLPFHFISALITPDESGMTTLAKIPNAFGIDPDGRKDAGLINVFFWIDSKGLLRSVIIPRRRHRPDIYFRKDENERIVVAPGAIDMTGLVITPREQDFNRIDSLMLRHIYAQTAFADKLPDDIKSYFNI